MKGFKKPKRIYKLSNTSRNWCITTWKEPELKNTERMNYYVYKKEICPDTGKEHWHLYIEFDNYKPSMRTVINIVGDKQAHYEPREGTQESAIEYVIKDESKAGEPVYWGTKKKQGKRSDIDEIWKDITEGDSLDEILVNHQGNALRMIHCIEKGAAIFHGFNSLNSWIKLNRIEHKDKLDEKTIEDLETRLLNKF